MKWKTRIEKIGKQAINAIKDSGQVTLQYYDYKKHVEDSAIYIDQKPNAPLCENDEIVIGNGHFYIVGLGKDVNQQLKEDGTCTVDFSGNLFPTSSTSIMLVGEDNPENYIRRGVKMSIA